MSTFIGNARTEIEDLWIELLYGDEERAAFFPFFDGECMIPFLPRHHIDLCQSADEHTEELLAIHEEEIMKLKDELRSKARLLASVKKYSEICEEEKELAVRLLLGSWLSSVRC
jgi:protein regulator of cytokinesis 1